MLMCDACQNYMLTTTKQHNTIQKQQTELKTLKTENTRMREALEQERYNSQMKIEKLNQKLDEGRNYLMGVRPDELQIDNILEILGFGKNGLEAK